MKKFLALTLMFAMLAAFAACSYKLPAITYDNATQTETLSSTKTLMIVDGDIVLVEKQENFVSVITFNYVGGTIIEGTIVTYWDTFSDAAAYENELKDMTDKVVNVTREKNVVSAEYADSIINAYNLVSKETLFNSFKAEVTGTDEPEPSSSPDVSPSPSVS